MFLLHQRLLLLIPFLLNEFNSLQLLIPVHLTSLHHSQTLFRAAYHPPNKSASLAITHNTTRGCLTITRLWPILTGIQKVTSRTDRQALPCLWVLATSGMMFLMTGTSNSSVKSGHRWKTMICYELVYNDCYT